MPRTLWTVVVIAAVGAEHGSAFAYGESDAQGRPNHDERRLHLLTNQVRAEPHAFFGWDTSLAGPEPRPPVALLPALNEAARFHADDMSTAGCFQHESCDGTAFFARIGRFFSGPAGENIAKGYPDVMAVMIGWMNSPGHRVNILRPEWNALGTGSAPGNHWVQNFGQVRGAVMPTIVAGAAFAEPSGLRLAAHAYDAAERAPRSFEARLGGVSIPLAPAFGPTGNQTWEARVPTPSACTDLVFILDTADDARHRFPSTGALRAGPGCAASFRPAEGAPAPSGPSIGGSPAGPSRPTIDADSPDAGGCRCLVGGIPPDGRPWLLIGFAVVVFGARRRRRGRD